MKKKMIPFNKVETYDQEFLKNFQILKKKSVYSSCGYFTKKCEKWINENLKSKFSVLTHSCTAALEMTAILLDLKKNDEIIMPSYTFVSTANAFVLRGAKPVFIDINQENLNIDINQIEKAITKKTKAIVIVHYAGISCEIDKIKKIAKKRNIYLIEDAAHSILAYYKKKPLGSFGDFATLSFHESKNMHCGQGGALLINNQKFIKRAKILRDKGTNRDQFTKNLVNKYSWVDLGSSFALTEILATFLYTQLKRAKKNTKIRVLLWNSYFKVFKEFMQKGYLDLPIQNTYSKHNGHIFFVIIKKKRKDFINYFKKKGIICLFHYTPLHNSIAGKKFGISKKIENTDSLSNRVVRFPIFSDKKILSKKYFKKIKFYLEEYFK